MSGYTDQVTRELLALTEPDVLGTGLDRGKVRRMLAEAWAAGYEAGMDDEAYEAYGGAARGEAVNPFTDGEVAMNGDAELSITYGTDDGTVTISGRQDLVAAFLRPPTPPRG